MLFSRVFSRFQHTNYYSSGKLSQQGSASFTRPSTGLSIQSSVHSMQPTTDSPHVTPLNPTVGHGFLPPPTSNPSAQGIRGPNKQEIGSPATRLQQAPPSIGMHPTFRSSSDFNLSLRYFWFTFFFVLIFAWKLFVDNFWVIFQRTFAFLEFPSSFKLINVYLFAILGNNHHQ